MSTRTAFAIASFATIAGFAVGLLSGIALVRVPEPPPPRWTTPTMPVSAPVEPEPVATIRDLFDAIAQVETGGERDPDAATGDGGRSIGRYQIGRAYWLDSGLSGEWENVRDPAYAEAVMLAYWGRWEPEALAALDFETLARIHQGGPSWREYPANLAYWHRVESALN